MGNPKLVQGKREYSIDKTFYVIGRDEKGSDLYISSRISKKEAVIVKERDGYYLRYVGTGNTKFKSGGLEVTLSKGCNVKLENGNIISFGGIEYKFVIS